MFNTAAFNGKRRTIALLTALAVAIGTIAIAMSAAPADAGRGAKVLGATKKTPKPSCKKKQVGKCQVMGKVTGIQTKADGKSALFKVPKTGHIVAWSTRLAVPDNKMSRPFFEENLAHKRYGKGPYARLAILKNAKGKTRFTLAKQSPAMKLNSSLGEQPIFTLKKPIRVKKGRVIALTVPTWATNYADGAGGSQWLASRSSKRCDLSSSGDPNGENLKKSRAQLKVGSTRKYGCRYSAERILYWAYFVPKKKGGKN